MTKQQNLKQDAETKDAKPNKKALPALAFFSLLAAGGIAAFVENKPDCDTANPAPECLTANVPSNTQTSGPALAPETNTTPVTKTDKPVSVNVQVFNNNNTNLSVTDGPNGPTIIQHGTAPKQPDLNTVHQAGVSAHLQLHNTPPQ